MILFRLIAEVEENLGVKVRAGVDPQAISVIASTVGRATTKEIVLLSVKNVGNVVRTTTSRLFANLQA